jgi:hypothetical protein
MNPDDGGPAAAQIVYARVNLEAHPIPPMDHPLGKHWDQPDRFEITIDATHALMSRDAFAQLSDYTYSQPSAVYPGKMWKAGNKNNDQERGRWWLHWWSAHPTDEQLCRHHVREILIT